MMEPKYFDIHTHVNFAAFDADREEVILRAREAGVAMMNVGTQKDTSKKAIEMAEQYDHCYACIGLHPIHTGKSYHDEKEIGEGGQEFTSRGEGFDYEYYLALAKHPKVLAIGETGLDYYRTEGDTVAKQREAFLAHIRLAKEVGKPLMIHARPSQGTCDAYEDVIEILREHDVRANFHFYTGDIPTAKKILAIGATMSFDGPITFSHDYDELIRFLPLESIMIETDAPYVAPKAFRGKRNEPSYVTHVLQAIAAIKGEDEEKVRATIAATSKKVFGFS